jgi:LPS sulfotransferase NodH
VNGRGPTPFVVLTFPRTGSAWLIETLDSHAEIAAYPELFLPGGDVARYASTNVTPFDTVLAALPRWRRRGLLLHRIAYLRRLYADRPGAGAVGFKLMYAQAAAQKGLLHYFALRRVRVVHLIRANLLDAVVSYQVAKATGVFHPRRGEVVPSVSVSLDAERLRGRLEELDLSVSRARGWIERYRLPRVEVAYEELVQRRGETLERVLRFLGVDPRVDALGSSFLPTGAGPRAELVENFGAVRDALAGTRFEWMLHEPGVTR